MPVTASTMEKPTRTETSGMLNTRVISARVQTGILYVLRTDFVFQNNKFWLEALRFLFSDVFFFRYNQQSSLILILKGFCYFYIHNSFKCWSIVRCLLVAVY